MNTEICCIIALFEKILPNIYRQARMLSSSLLRAILFLLVASHVLAKKNNTSTLNQERKNVTNEKRQNIGKYTTYKPTHKLLVNT